MAVAQTNVPNSRLFKCNQQPKLPVCQFFEPQPNGVQPLLKHPLAGSEIFFESLGCFPLAHSASPTWFGRQVAFPLAFKRNWSSSPQTNPPTECGLFEFGAPVSKRWSLWFPLKTNQKATKNRNVPEHLTLCLPVRSGRFVETGSLLAPSPTTQSRAAGSFLSATFGVSIRPQVKPPFKPILSNTGQCMG